MKHMLNEEGFIKAYDDHGDAIFRYFYFRVSDRERAKDFTQETFMRTWEYIAKGNEVKSIKAFLYQVARNLMIDHSRKKTMESLDALQELGFNPGKDDRPHLHLAIDARTALQVIHQLDEKYRDVVLMRYVDGFTPKEIAKDLNETENVVSVRLHRALKKIKDLLESKENQSKENQST